MSSDVARCQELAEMEREEGLPLAAKRCEKIAEIGKYEGLPGVAASC